MNQPTASFAAILQRNMGDSAWNRLHANIRQRFAAECETAKRLYFSGSMDQVHCSPCGALLARLLQRLSILPATRALAVQFDFSIARGASDFTKCRRYHFTANDTFTFSSSFSDEHSLHEEFAGGLGMYLELLEENGALLFRDRGYYLRLGNWYLNLPRWLCIGSFELLHRDIDQQHFQVIIRIQHPVLGTLFFQKGLFSQHGALAEIATHKTATINTQAHLLHHGHHQYLPACHQSTGSNKTVRRNLTGC